MTPEKNEIQDKGKENSFKVVLNSAGLSNIYINKNFTHGPRDTIL